MATPSRRTWLFGFGSLTLGVLAATRQVSPLTTAAQVLSTPTTLPSSEPVVAPTGNALSIPPLLSPPVGPDGMRTFDLSLQRGQMRFLPDRPVQTFGINGAYLGPTLRASQGDMVNFNISNQLGEPTTLHWHGMLLPAMSDGNPHQEIAAGATWQPMFDIRQQAATLWFLAPDGPDAGAGHARAGEPVQPGRRQPGPGRPATHLRGGRHSADPAGRRARRDRRRPWRRRGPDAGQWRVRTRPRHRTSAPALPFAERLRPADLHARLRGRRPVLAGSQRRRPAACPRAPDPGAVRPSPAEQGRKDTVMVRPRETVPLLLRFTDYADETMPYMYHCHILQHEDQGMMGQFVVMPA